MINTNELLFCVDENNNPIRPRPRRIVHETGIWHRTSHIWIINKKKQILCQRRSLLKDKAPGLWEGFFGGHIPPNTTYINHAITELQEETGLDVNKSDLRKIFVYKYLKGKEFIGVFVLEWNGDENNLTLEPDEVDMVRWIDVNEFRILIVKNVKDWSTMDYQDNLFKLLGI